MECKPSLYHYNGFCFNRSRVPDGQLALPVFECEEIDKEVSLVITT